MNLAVRDDVQEYVSASAVTDIYYIANRNLRNKKIVKNLIEQLLKVFLVAGVTKDEIKSALALEWNDFEDSVQYSVAVLSEMDGIVTRNSNDYKQSELPIWSPEQICEKLANNH